MLKKIRSNEKRDIHIIGIIRVPGEKQENFQKELRLFQERLKKADLGFSYELIYDSAASQSKQEALYQADKELKRKNRLLNLRFCNLGNCNSSNGFDEFGF